MSGVGRLNLGLAPQPCFRWL